MAVDPVSLDEQIACAERELRLRLNIYPRWVKLGKMNQAAAEHEVDCMVAIVRTLQELNATKAA